MVRQQRGRGQIVSIARGDGGCSNSKREIMKTIVHSLGLRNVHRRNDRDQFLEMQLENLDPQFEFVLGRI